MTLVQDADLQYRKANMKAGNMLSFKQLSEKKTKIKMNPKLQDVQECPDEMDIPKKKVCPTHG